MFAMHGWCLMMMMMSGADLTRREWNGRSYDDITLISSRQRSMSHFHVSLVLLSLANTDQILKYNIKINYSRIHTYTCIYMCVYRYIYGLRRLIILVKVCPKKNILVRNRVQYYLINIFPSLVILFLIKHNLE